MHDVLVNRLGGLSLPRKSVVRLTDRPDMTLDVYRGRKTTIQQHILLDQESNPLFKTFKKSCGKPNAKHALKSGFLSVKLAFQISRSRFQILILYSMTTCTFHNQIGNKNDF